MKKKPKREPKSLKASELRDWLRALKMVELIRYRRATNVINEMIVKASDTRATERAVKAMCASLLRQMSAGRLGA